MPDNLRQLTSFRFFAAAWVVLFGFWGLLRPEARFGAPPLVVAKGYLGVELFFVLSGFILSHVYAEALVAGRFRYGGFLWARLARIYPLHLATLVAMGAMAAGAALVGLKTEHSIASPASLPANLLLIHSWGLLPGGSWNHPSWSISAEWAAYLAFPGFAAVTAALRRRPALALSAALCALFAVYAAFEALTGAPLTRATTIWGPLRIAAPFFYGCVLHLAWRSGPVPSAREAGLATALFLLLTAVSAGMGAPDAVTVAAAGGLILALASLSAAGSPVLASPAFVWLGEVSFALYMVKAPWEVLFGNLVKRGLHLGDDAPWPWAAWAALLVGCLAAAALAHHGVERPARLLLRRVGRMRPAAPREEVAPAL